MPAPPSQRRMSAQRKREAVLRVLRDEDLELVSREPGVTAAALSGWRDDFLAAGPASLKSRPADVGAADPGVDHGAPGDDLAVVGVDDEGPADDVAVPAGELEPVRPPAQVRAHDDHLAVANMLRALRAFPRQQQVVGLHDPVDRLVIDRGQALRAQLAVQDRIAGGRSEEWRNPWQLRRWP